ncbi:hypothetical protein G3A56_16195 (plasmid) [Rhizobium oryzihabitans]|uniref:Uncharacterized protein n=1 Tax=Rhizobium oryzihabitans TaxID=2267833 RepID=A0A7L5BKZ7_9HYPH|nr:hypothetical protein [Rhizobium oryzihabitans]QIB39539.1 hypothetical protein G3A56_16195 [Rhizobium oryzihabitans]
MNMSRCDLWSSQARSRRFTGHPRFPTAHNQLFEPSIPSVGHPNEGNLQSQLSEKGERDCRPHSTSVFEPKTRTIFFRRSLEWSMTNASAEIWTLGASANIPLSSFTLAIGYSSVVSPRKASPLNTWKAS